MYSPVLIQSTYFVFSRYLTEFTVCKLYLLLCATRTLGLHGMRYYEMFEVLKYVVRLYFEPEFQFGMFNKPFSIHVLISVKSVVNAHINIICTYQLDPGRRGHIRCCNRIVLLDKVWYFHTAQHKFRDLSHLGNLSFGKKVV